MSGPRSPFASGIAEPPAPIWLEVRAQVDVERARRTARAFAAAIGFPAIAREEIVLAVSELATNLARYARGGRLHFHVIAADTSGGMEIESHDLGPGIADLARALEDGTSTGGGLGAGLPAVARLMDSIQIATSPAGTTIVTRKRLPA